MTSSWKNKACFAALILSLITGVWHVPGARAQTPAAAQPYAVLAPLPCIPSAPNPDVPGDKGVVCDKGGNYSLQKTIDFKQYLQYMFNLLIAVAAVAAVVRIVWGGIEYMTTSSFTTKKSGLDKVTHAIYGLVMVLASYLILRTIDPRLVAIPNTLVPQLHLQNVDSVDILGQLQSHANQYHAQGLDILQKEQLNQQNIDSKQKLLDDVNKKLSDIYSGQTNATDDELKELTRTRSTLTSDIAALNAQKDGFAFGKEATEILFETLDSFKSAGLDAGNAIQKIIAGQKKINAFRDYHTSEQEKRGQYDHTDINNYGNNADAQLDLLIADEMTSSIQSSRQMISNAPASGSGTGGFGVHAQNVYSVELPTGDGTSLQDSLDKAKALVQTQINKASAEVNNITDPQLQAALRQKIELSQSFLNSKK